MRTAIGIEGLSRRAFLAGTAATLAAACRGDDDRADPPATTPPATTSPPTTPPRTTPPPNGLALKGVNYDTERDVWRPEYVRRELETIRRDLHCNAVFLLGSDVERLTQSATIAADNGLHVWFEPRHFDSDAADTIEFVASVARAAEELRTEHRNVGLSLGVELTLFMHGLVPGADWTERATALGRLPPARYNRRLNAFLADALPLIRPLFGGQVTYSSGSWEEVDWRDFDVLGIDLYRDAENASTFVEDVRRLHRHGKPVVITEFGCCAFRGAEDLGGTGFFKIDWTKTPPLVEQGLVRDEQVQASYIDELLDVFTAEGVHGAFVYDFIEPGNPHTPDARHDLDMAGFGVVKCYPTGHELAYDRTGHFERKSAFDTIATRFR